jgi:hypothetical protein
MLLLLLLLLLVILLLLHTRCSLHLLAKVSLLWCHRFGLIWIPVTVGHVLVLLLLLLLLLLLTVKSTSGSRTTWGSLYLHLPTG